MPTTAAGIATLACAVLLPRVTVNARVPAVVPVPNETDGPPANCPADDPSAKVTVGSSLTPPTADWKASVTVPLPLDTDPDARLTERLPCCALAGVARFSWIDGAGKTGGGGAAPMPWSGIEYTPMMRAPGCGPASVGLKTICRPAAEPPGTSAPAGEAPASW